MTLQLAWIDAWFESATLDRQGSPSLSSRRMEHVWHMRNVPGWPELDAFYALEDSDLVDVIADVRSTDPDPSLLVTVFSTNARLVLARYRERGLDDSGNFSQPFMRRSLQGLGSTAEGQIGQELKHELHRSSRVLEHKTMLKDRLVSTAKASLNTNGVAYIWGMQTDPEMRRRGLASHGLDMVLRESKMRGMHEAVLCASPLGVPFYNARDFVAVAEMMALCPADPSAWLTGP